MYNNNCSCKDAYVVSVYIPKYVVYEGKQGIHDHDRVVEMQIPNDNVHVVIGTIRHSAASLQNDFNSYEIP